MNNTRKLPVGIENFGDIRRLGFYYVDKTGLIEELLDNWSIVTLFTRPRRFGKTLNMSMLQHFFELGTDPALFEGLQIANRRDLCEEYLGKYPVVFLSLKGVDGLTFDEARRMLRSMIATEAGRHYEIKSSESVSAENKVRYERLLREDDETLGDSLRILSELLYQHYGQKIILLVDEYDVPLDKAFQNGYYREMVALMRSFLGQALKTNPYLQFAALTGCLRISKESIFTGLNNFEVNTIADVAHDEHFGFTSDEVQRILQDYALEDKADLVREWYDGYHFGDADIYCPWDVIRYVKKLRTDPLAEPEAFWINTSGNGLVKRFIDKADKMTRDEIERLIAGEAIEKRIRLELTYEEMDASIDNLWSVLYTTGYLTKVGRPVAGIYHLTIPNREVREVYVDQIQVWFRETILQDQTPLQMLSQAFLAGQAEEIERQLNTILSKTISIQDTKARAGQKENFYHGLLLGLLRSNAEWMIRSNPEAGDGFSDIVVEPEDLNAGIVIEIKYATTIAGLDQACASAIQQIRDRRYAEYLCNDGRGNILAYGIAFCKKRCRVVVSKEY